MKAAFMLWVQLFVLLVKTQNNHNNLRPRTLHSCRRKIVGNDAATSKLKSELIIPTFHEQFLIGSVFISWLL